MVHGLRIAQDEDCDGDLIGEMNTTARGGGRGVVTAREEMEISAHAIRSLGVALSVKSCSILQAQLDPAPDADKEFCSACAGCARARAQRRQ